MPVSFRQLAKDVTFYGGIVVALLSVLANVPALHGVFSASGTVQAVVDGSVAVLSAALSVLKQIDQAVAVQVAKAEGYKAGRDKKAMPK